MLYSYMLKYVYVDNEVPTISSFSPAYGWLIALDVFICDISFFVLKDKYAGRYTCGTCPGDRALHLFF